MFIAAKTLKEKCKEFSDNAKEFRKKNKRKDTIIKLETIEKFFGFKSTDLKSNWLPKLIRDELKNFGIRLHKKRNRDYVLILFDDDNVKN